MMLTAIVLIPLIGGLLAWLADRGGNVAPRWIAFGAFAVDFVLLVGLWITHPGANPVGGGPWLLEANAPWIPAMGISFHLALDGLSLLLLVLTAFLGMLSVAISWTEIKEHVGFFHLNLLWVLAGTMGVFTAMDLFLFSFFWEMMLVPMYFLIAIWGHENKLYASVKFFVYTQISGLLMLLAILALYFIHGRETGTYTFDYAQLIGTTLSATESRWIMLGFFIAFAVKLPAVPVHNWLPDAHTEAPTAGSVVLAGLLLKTGAYGLLRFVLPLFPANAEIFAPIAMTLGVIGILYGAVLAFAQTDLKRLVAYSSVSHMGFVILGVFAWNPLALQGAVMQIICHGLGTGALFILVGALQERIHTRDIRQMGGLWTSVPKMGAVAMFFALASLGLPGLGSFIGEFLVLAGAYQANKPLTVVASLGLVFGTIYSLWIVLKVFHGPVRKEWKLPDLSAREIAVMASLMAGLIWLGLYPQPVFDTARPALEAIQSGHTVPALPAVPRAPITAQPNASAPAEPHGGTS